jgi:hypothetical protein
MDKFRPLIRILVTCAAAYLALLIGCVLFQRKLLYIPSNHQENNGLSEWRHEGQLIGFARHAASPGAVWLFLHGNAGQAADRTYVLPSFSSLDSVYILEYPGYGSRPGSPSRSSFNAAARQAYEMLREQFPDRPVCVAAESIGCGPAAFLAANPRPPDKIVLILPFDTLADVAAQHYPFLPVKILLRDNWDNITSLKSYQGELELYGARADTIIPISHAKAVAASKPSARFHIIDGDHNDWSEGTKVKIRYLPQKNRRN